MQDGVNRRISHTRKPRIHTLLEVETNRRRPLPTRQIRPSMKIAVPLCPVKRVDSQLDRREPALRSTPAKRSHRHAGNSILWVAISLLLAVIT